MKQLKNMKKYEFLEFATADACFIAYGKSLDDVFANAALAMFEVMTDTKTVKPKIKKEIKVGGEDLKSLMFNWLNELIFYVDTQSMLFSKFDVKINKEKNILKAKVFGEKINPKKHEIREDVKACTYHRMEIKQVDGIWQAQLIVDI